MARQGNFKRKLSIWDMHPGALDFFMAPCTEPYILLVFLSVIVKGSGGKEDGDGQAAAKQHPA